MKAAPRAVVSRFSGRTTRTPSRSAWNCISRSLAAAPPSTRTSRSRVPVSASIARHQVGDLERDALERGARARWAPVDAARQAQDRAARRRIPLGRPQAGERGHDDDAAGVRTVAARSLTSGARRDDLEAVAQPLDRGAADEDAALERVGRSARRRSARRRSRAAGCGSRRACSPVNMRRKQPVPYVHFTRPGRVQSCPKSAACWSPRIPAIGTLPPRTAREVSATCPPLGTISGRTDGRNVEKPRELRVPAARAQIHQHRARGVGDVGDVPPAARQVPDEPGVDRPGGERSRGGPSPRPGHVVEEPAELRAGEVRVEQEARLPADRGLAAGRAEPFHGRLPCAGPATRSRCARGCPVARSQSTTVSRWLVMPIAARSRAARPASSRAPAARRRGSSSRSHRRRARPSRAAESAARTPSARRRARGPRCVEDDRARAARSLIEGEDVGHGRDSR